MLGDALTRLGEAVRMLHVVDMRTKRADASAEDKQLAALAELTAHRQVISTVRSLHVAGTNLPLDDFESVYLNHLSNIYADVEEALRSGGEPGWLLFNAGAAADRRSALLSNVASLIAAIGTELLYHRDAAFRSARPSRDAICEVAGVLSSGVADWVRNQPSVGEESLTDWLLYRLSALASWIRYIPFSRYDEGTKTGADWEWWFVGDATSLGIRVQAKSFGDIDDVYRLLAYTNKRGLQVEMLLEAAATNKLLPWFAFYHSEPTPNTTLCSQWSSHSRANGVFVADAERCYDQFVRPGRHRIGPVDVLSQSCALPCLFCCAPRSDPPPSLVDELIAHIRRSLRTDPAVPLPGVHESLPGHVMALLNSQRAEPPHWIAREFAGHLRGVSALLAFDLRSQSSERQ